MIYAALRCGSQADNDDMLAAPGNNLGSMSNSVWDRRPCVETSRDHLKDDTRLWVLCRRLHQCNQYVNSERI